MSRWWEWSRGAGLALVIAVGRGVAVEGAPAADGSRATWVIATYNVGNYTLADRRVAGVFRRDYPKPEKEKEALRSVIARLDADVLVLQEIGGAAFLAELRRDLQSEGVDYAYGDTVDAADPDRRLAWLARHRPTEVRTHVDLTCAYAGRVELVRRGLLELRWDDASGGVTVFGVHLKSRVTRETDDPEAAGRRRGEAEAIRRRILERVVDLNDRRLILVGDFNDTRTSPVLARFQTQRGQPLFEIVDAADSRGERWTYRFDREDTYTRVDYVLVSGRIAVPPGGILATVLDGPDVALASDHRPVRMELAR